MFTFRYVLKEKRIFSLAFPLASLHVRWFIQHCYWYYQYFKPVVLNLGPTEPFQGFDEGHRISVTHFYFLLDWAKMGFDKAWKTTWWSGLRVKVKNHCFKRSYFKLDCRTRVPWLRTQCTAIDEGSGWNSVLLRLPFISGRQPQLFPLTAITWRALTWTTEAAAGFSS